MFSPTLEVILTIAHREAGSRRHTHLTLEHLLYALAHDAEGEQILSAVGVDLRAARAIDLDTYLDEVARAVQPWPNREPEQTLAFRRVLQTAVLHVQSAGRDEVRAGDVLAAMLQEQKSYAAQLLDGQGVTRLDVLELHLARHQQVPRPARREPATSRQRAASTATMTKRATRRATRWLAYTINLSERAAAGKLDPLIGRAKGAAAHHPDPLPPSQEQSRVRRRARRRQDRDGGRARAAAARTEVPAPLKGAEVFALDSTALLAGTRFRGDFEERFKAVIGALAQRNQPDPVHRRYRLPRSAPAPRRAARWIRRPSSSPSSSAGELRVIGSTTFEEFKHIDPRPRARATPAEVAIDEPSVEETVRILKGLQRRYEEHHHVRYTDEAIEAAARLADATCATCACPTAQSTCSTRPAR